MKNLLPGIMAVIILEGCGGASPVKIELDTAAVDELPRSVAIDYLNKTSKSSDEHLFLSATSDMNESQKAKYSGVKRCSFTDNGLYMFASFRPHFKPALFPYEDLYITSEISALRTGNIFKAVAGSTGDVFTMSVSSDLTPNVFPHYPPNAKGELGGFFSCSIMAEQVVGKSLSQDQSKRASKAASALISLGVKVEGEK